MSPFREEEDKDHDPRKREFLSEYREQYGYSHVAPLHIDELRANEFPQLKGKRRVCSFCETRETDVDRVREMIRTMIYWHPLDKNMSFSDYLI